MRACQKPRVSCFMFQHLVQHFRTSVLTADVVSCGTGPDHRTTVCFEAHVIRSIPPAADLRVKLLEKPLLFLVVAWLTRLEATSGMKK